jgi:hypothetical protein
MLETRDGADSWTQLAIPTARDLEAVYVSGDGEAIFAVGEAGVVVVHDERVAASAPSLPAIHQPTPANARWINNISPAALT